MNEAAIARAAEVVAQSTAHAAQQAPRTDIVRHIQTVVLPLYSAFDAAHNLAHAEAVIANSLAIAAGLDADIDMVYVIAAYHDVGLRHGREGHEKASAAFLLADEALREWFSGQALRLMAEAIEDHRASNAHPPRSLYGCIVAEADRDLDYTHILGRCVRYSLQHFPGYGREQHFDRTRRHMDEKYGEGGYMKLWLNTEANARGLLHIRAMLAAPESLRADFDRIFDGCVDG